MKVMLGLRTPLVASAVAASILAVTATPAPSAPTLTATAKADFASGFDLLKAGNTYGAIKAFQAGLKLDPSNALAHFYMAEAYRAAGDADDARVHYQKSLALKLADPQAGAARNLLAALTTPRPPAPHGEADMPRAPSPAGENKDSGPTMDVTIAFIREKLIANPKTLMVSQNEGVRATYEVLAEFAPDPAACRLKVDYWSMDAELGLVTKGYGLADIDLRQVATVDSAPYGGYDPPVYAVTIACSGANNSCVSGTSSAVAYLSDQSVSTRVATAVRHAIQLCGGDKIVPPKPEAF